MNDLYDVDLASWSERQAELLRRRAAGELANEAEIDWQNIAEEIESVGDNTRHELRNRLARLLQHLLRWHYQPEHRSRSWQSTIRTQRQEIEDLLADNPSLKSKLPELFLTAYPRARTDALDETGLLDLPQASPFTVEQALGKPLSP
jgi:predicted  nucleic acid-binding Zn-ribbon protein